MSLTKNPEPRTKKFVLIADSKTFQVIWGFEQLPSAFGTRIMPVQSMCKQLYFCANRLN